MKKITYILLSACFLLTSCEDFLNRDPDAKVGINGMSLGGYVSGL